MIQFVAAAFLAALLLPAGQRALAQSDPAEIVALGVELWPDYDRPDMLVLLTGTLPPDTTLPATLTIPIPAGADINAVARFTTDNQLLSDVDYTVDGEQLTMTLPDVRFRVEYYAPFTTSGDSRSYDFRWLSDLPVGQLSTVIQQPSAAEDFAVVPEPVNVTSNRGDGLQYHSLASRAVAAREPFDITVAYASPTGELSAPAVSPQATLPASVGTTPVETGGLFENFDPIWLLVILGVGVLVGLAFFLGRQQTTAAGGRPRKPTPSRPAQKQPSQPPAAKSTTPTAPTAGAPRFCHHCGQALATGDRFCRSCGTPVKPAD